jgi:small subunit ribosomal protein S6
MRQYELMIVVHPDKVEDDAASLIESIGDWVKGLNGEVSQVDNWGRRRLAYPIQHQREGLYFLFHLVLNPDTIAELERSLRLSEPIIRHLIVRADE